MRKLLLSIIFLLTPGLGFAQLDLVHEPGPAIAVKGGMSMGLTPATLRENYTTSYAVGGWASTPVNAWLVLRPAIEFGQLAFDVREYLEDHQNAQTIVRVTGGDYRSLAIGLDAVIGFNRSSMVASYGIIGVGYYSGIIEDFRIRAIEDVSIVEGESDAGLGLSGGAGIRADMNHRIGAFAEMKVIYGRMGQSHLVFPVGVGIFLKL
jgi:hypothetical protein